MSRCEMAGLTLRHGPRLVFIAEICRGFKLFKERKKKQVVQKLLQNMEIE